VILGTGTDLIDVRRIERALARFGHRFAQRVLVDDEYRRYRTHTKPAHYVAKRFAAKEAFSKAMGTGIHFPVNWHNVSVANERSGRPYLKFSEPLSALMSQRGIRRTHLSLTDEIEMACAFVILEGDEPGNDHE
jgi:holo-[acyl-carrier protein] synthase